jgi:hypothetical protein
MAYSDEEDVHDNSDNNSDVTPTEEGSGTRWKREDSEDSGASGNGIEDDDQVDPANASATKFAIKKKGERATEVEGNAVA